MILQTSFFNMGIYKSAVKRYIWGSVLYFIILFISTGLNLLTSVNLGRIDTLTEHQIKSYSNLPLVLRSGYLAFPVIMAIFVPTITALLIFKYVHSKKSAIFTHSIPVTKKANYFSFDTFQTVVNIRKSSHCPPQDFSLFWSHCGFTNRIQDAMI